MDVNFSEENFKAMMSLIDVAITSDEAQYIYHAVKFLQKHSGEPTLSDIKEFMERYE